MTDLERQIRTGAFVREDAEGCVITHTVDVSFNDWPAIALALRENLWNIGGWTHVAKGTPRGHYRVTFFTDFVEREPELPL